MKELTAVNVDAIIRDCLFKEGEDTSTAIVVDGIMSKFGFHPERLESHKEEIGQMLDQLPKNFRKDVGGGWSFLNACQREDGQLWGEHQSMECLFVLGIATKQAECLIPREQWRLMPGGMPYYAVITNHHSDDTQTQTTAGPSAPDQGD